MWELNRYVVIKQAIKWKEIGGELGLKPEVINNIGANFQSFDREKHESCLKEVFKKWLEVDTGATWSKLELALTNVARAEQGLPPVSYLHKHGKWFMFIVFYIIIVQQQYVLRSYCMPFVLKCDDVKLI